MYIIIARLAINTIKTVCSTVVLPIGIVDMHKYNIASYS